jgi:hypothetical protein
MMEIQRQRGMIPVSEALMQDLIAWLRVQLDADEWLFKHWPGDLVTQVATRDGLHFAHWDPARALFDVEAKRAVLDAYDGSQPSDYPDFDGGFGAGLLLAVKHVALAYRDRPGYREEWRP